MNQFINLDQLVDYRAEYTSVLSKNKLNISGDRLLGLCSFHQEHNLSFSVDLKTGKWYCFAEGEGGIFIIFWAKLHNTDGGPIRKFYVKIQKTAGIF